MNRSALRHIKFMNTCCKIRSIYPLRSLCMSSFFIVGNRKLYFKTIPLVFLPSFNPLDSWTCILDSTSLIFVSIFAFPGEKGYQFSKVLYFAWKCFCIPSRKLGNFDPFGLRMFTNLMFHNFYAGEMTRFIPIETTLKAYQSRYCNCMGNQIEATCSEKLTC